MPATAVGSRVRRFGIRHHGPGSARSLVAALEEWRPDLILLEAPVETAAALAELGNDAVVPPVAVLVYAVDEPSRASFYPVAEFSPEYQAVRWALAHGVEVVPMDLPAAVQLEFRVQRTRAEDPLAIAAQAAGFEDFEQWWDHLVERRPNTGELFEGIEDLMAEIRALPTRELAEDGAEPSDEFVEAESDGGRPVLGWDAFNEMREAWMRRTLRQALATGSERIAVVCGAMHGPALRELPPAKQDDARLHGLPKSKVAATLVPWTYDRLCFASGYGAGTDSPAYYDLLWRTPPEDVPTRWLLSVAGLMRAEDLDASPASVIEAVRLADALAALRGRPHAGLRELREAATSVLHANEAVWSLIGRRLIVGERLGEVPPTVPQVPLAADLAAQRKRLRLKADEGQMTLDLRNDTDLERSRLLHRLCLLGVWWGGTTSAGRVKGTFVERWLLSWRPEYAVALVEASVYGNTVLEAATRRVTELVGSCEDLAEIASLLKRSLEADLEGAVGPTLARLQALSATASDVAQLADALPPLAAIARYGNVRRTSADQVVPIVDALFARLCLGLPGASLSLDDDAARQMGGRLTAVQSVVQLLASPLQTEGDAGPERQGGENMERWLAALAQLADARGAHPLVTGRAERLRFDLGAIDGEHLAERLSQKASTGATALETAAFVEGLLGGSGLVLLHQDALFRTLDDWLCGLSDETFDEILPLVRRTFALFPKPERRQIGERVAGGRRARVLEQDLDEARAQRVLPVLRQILGVEA